MSSVLNPRPFDQIAAEASDLGLYRFSSELSVSIFEGETWLTKSELGGSIFVTPKGDLCNAETLLLPAKTLQEIEPYRAEAIRALQALRGSHRLQSDKAVAKRGRFDVFCIVRPPRAALVAVITPNNSDYRVRRTPVTSQVVLLEDATCPDETS